MFSEIDVVVIRKLVSSSRPVDGTAGLVRQPVVGDAGTIVQVLAPHRFTVECVEEGTGCTIWLADFDAGELAEPPVDWRFAISEVSANVYRATGDGPRGLHVESTDTNATLALANCRAFAISVQHG
jgi:hypothetical protein